MSEEGHGDQGMGTFCLALLLGVLARTGLIQITKIIRLPYTVIVLLFGLLIGGVLEHYKQTKGHQNENIFAKSVDNWVNISSSALLFTILPILIFESSFSSDLHIFMKQIVAVLVLAIPAVIFQTALIGLFVM